MKIQTAEVKTAKELAILGVKPNVLGVGVSTARVPAVKISPGTVAHRHAHELIQSTNIDAVRSLMKEINRTHQLMEEHSPVLFDAKIRELSEQYSKDPCEKSMRALRHARSLTERDHSLVQEHQMIRQKELLLQLTPLLHPLYKRAADLLQSDVDSLSAFESEQAAVWESSPADSPLLTSLRAFLADVRTIAHAEQPRFPNLPPLVVALLQIDAERTAGQ